MTKRKSHKSKYNHCNGQAKKGQKDEQWSTKLYTENYISSNTNTTYKFGAYAIAGVLLSCICDMNQVVPSTV